MPNLSISDWKLPAKPQGKVWLPVVRLGRTIPWGYEQDPDEPMQLNPIPEQLEFLQQAKKHLRQFTYEEVSDWLSAQTGRYISSMGLTKRLKRERRNKKQAIGAAYYAKKFKEAQTLAEELEKRIGCSGAYRDPDDSS